MDLRRIAPKATRPKMPDMMMRPKSDSDGIDRAVETVVTDDHDTVAPLALDEPVSAVSVSQASATPAGETAIAVHL